MSHRLAVCIAALGIAILACKNASSYDFGVPENILSEYPSVRFENQYTRVPTSGRLVSIKIADNGTVYYICHEKTSYVIYHLEVRPIPGYKDKIEQDMKIKAQNWDKEHPDELVFTKDRYEQEFRNNIKKYSEAVWIRNEIIVPPAPKRPQSQE
jgi:hypothetical protein